MVAMADVESQKAPMRMKVMKIMMLGDSQVGKSSMISRYADDVFTSSTISTLGIDFKILTIELRGQTIKLQIWDTAGQEKFQSITTLYYRGAMGIMLVYDITNPKSFDNIDKWLRNLEEYANDDTEKMIIGNKCDLIDKRMISKERGEAIGRAHNVSFLETSAKANINIDTAFLTLAEAIVDRVLPNKASIGRGAIVLGPTKRRWYKRC